MIEFNKHTNVIYADAAEKHVKAVMLHSDVDGKLFWDEALEHPIASNDLFGLLMKKLVLVKYWFEEDSEFVYLSPIGHYPPHENEYGTGFYAWYKGTGLDFHADPVEMD